MVYCSDIEQSNSGFNQIELNNVVKLWNVSQDRRANEEKEGEIKTKKWKNSGDRYWNMILHIEETVIRVWKKHCDVNNMCSMFFTRNIVFLMILLLIFSNIKVLSDCFFSNWITLESLES